VPFSFYLSLRRNMFFMIPFVAFCLSILKLACQDGYQKQNIL
jgi:hypothetical protein